MKKVIACLGLAACMLIPWVLQCTRNQPKGTQMHMKQNQKQPFK